MEIKKLSNKLINLIAAGEVVERPVSVVKELVENSLDAGAASIEVRIENGGKNFVSVADDGYGIDQNQVQLAFERHATSKIEDDIFNINFFGFRGEALPSIASVSKVVVESCHKNKEYTATFEYGNFTGFSPSRRTKGTKITVSDLFANTPVRLKFLKSERSEVMMCVNLVNKLALANHKVEFKLYSNGAIILSYNAATSEDERTEDVLGKEFVENSIPINFSNNRVQLKGRVGYPTLNKGMPHYIFNFVNGRTVRDKFLTQIVRNAYVNLIPGGRYPQTVLFFKFDNSEVDVNIHPTKQEIRLVDENYFKTLLQSEIRRVLKDHNLQNNTTIEKDLHESFDAVAVSKMRSKWRRSSYEFPNTDRKVGTGKRSPTPSVTPYGFKDSSMHDSAPVQSSAKSDKEELNERIDAQFLNNLENSSKDAPLGYAKCQIANSYIVAENGPNLIIVDQHAAHERVNLENFKEKASLAQSQTLAVPIVIKLSNSAEVEQITQHQELFKKFGIVFERNGSCELMVRAINSFLNAECIHNLITEFLHNENSNESSIEEKLIEVLGNIACKKSIKAGNRMSIEEMNSLLRRMESTNYAANCNHGRPTYITLSKDKLAKLFER